MDEKETLQQSPEENIERTQDESIEAGNELEVMKKELDEQKEKFIRLYADFDNFKRSCVTKCSQHVSIFHDVLNGSSVVLLI